MRRLYEDLLHYQPLVVGHFMQLDYHMMGVGFYRAGLDNPVSALPTFCTMITSSRFMQHSRQPPRGLRLGELHERLFGEPLAREHDALTDAYATARCFFALWQRGDINEQIIIAQRPLGEPGKPVSRRWHPSWIYLILLLALAALVALILF
jgi:DNA polymerase-3 subunit epsilon